MLPCKLLTIVCRVSPKEKKEELYRGKEVKGYADNKGNTYKKEVVALNQRR